MDWIVSDEVKRRLVYGEIDMRDLDLWMRPVVCRYSASESKLPSARDMGGFKPVQIKTHFSLRSMRLTVKGKLKHVWTNHSLFEITGVLVYDKRRALPFCWIPVWAGNANGGSVTIVMNKAPISFSR